MPNERLFPGEKKSLRRFLAIYLISSLLLIGVGSAIFYHYAYHRLIDHQNAALKFKTESIKPRLRVLHNRFSPTIPYPHLEGIVSALYDIDGRLIAGESKEIPPPWPGEFILQKNRICYHTKNQPYYLGAAHIVACTPLDPKPIESLRIKMAAAFVAAMLFVAAIAGWLGRLFLAPVHQTMAMLDRFIKDSTHELNTPVSTILTNVELLKNFHPELQKSDELNRIEIASRRLSRIYDDLAYIQLNHHRHKQESRIDLSALVEERTAYFKAAAKRRGVRLIETVEGAPYLKMDPEDAVRLVDNLLSNAIKYTPPGGRIHIKLYDHGLVIEDTGIGMSEETLAKATRRFFRAHEGEGGFGLGLNIVSGIVEEYGLKLSIESRPQAGTKVSISW